MNGFYWFALFVLVCKLIEVGGEWAQLKVAEALIWHYSRRYPKAGDSR